jgi:serine/threonine protein kinase/tetratricopeptide (TPR) repeat protein
MSAVTPHGESIADAETDLGELRAQQIRRWRAGERPQVEELLVGHANIAADAEATMVLIYGEVLLREEFEGSSPDVAEYCRRFPSLSDALTAQFDVHWTLSTATAAPCVPGFEIVRELGRGGMGVVYLAREAALGRLVALKMLLSGEFAAESARRRLRTEAEAVARLKHPHIVELHALGEQDGRPFLVMEYVAGGSLDRALDGTPLDPRMAAELVRSLVDGVEHAHAAGILHRDLKPGNVLLEKPTAELEAEAQRRASVHAPRCASASVKIADFGLAKRLDGTGSTATSQVLGTPSYMAPEQAGGARDAGRAADIYSLGAILYECLTGRPPFKAATPMETLAQIMDREPAAPRSLNPAVPRDLETICLKCLAKEPVKRYATAAGLRDDLQRYLDNRPVVARPVGALGRSWRWVKRRPALAAMAAALIVLIPTALVTTTVLYVRAEQRGRESLALRRESLERMSRLAVARSGEPVVADVADLHRACAEEYGRLAQAGIDPAVSRLHRAEHISWEAFELSRQGYGNESQIVAESAIRAFRDCLAENPSSEEARQGLFQARVRRAAAMRRLKPGAGVLPVFDELVAEAPEIYGHDLSLGSKLCLCLRDLHQNRGSVLYDLGRYAESETAYDNALRYDNGTKWADLVIVRACLWARAGRAAEAIEVLQSQLQNPHLYEWSVFNAACGFALASVADELSESARASAAESAIQSLRRVLAIAPNLRSVLETDPDMKPLRSRPDFQALLSDK